MRLYIAPVTKEKPSVITASETQKTVWVTSKTVIQRPTLSVKRRQVKANKHYYSRREGERVKIMIE